MAACIQAWTAEPGNVRDVSLEVRAESAVNSVLPQFDPLLGKGQSQHSSPCLSFTLFYVLCSLQLWILCTVFLQRKTQLSYPCLSVLPPPYWTASLIFS